MSENATSAPELTQARLKELLHYNPDEGVFTWRVRRKGTRSDQVAGGKQSCGYVEIRIDGKRHLAHRLAFLYVTGAVPSGPVDHINHNRSDNRWGNLREATVSQNLGNARLSKRNKSGHKGVYWDKRDGRWLAHIGMNGRVKRLGRFTDINDAISAYTAAAQSHFGEFANAARREQGRQPETEIVPSGLITG